VPGLATSARPAASCAGSAGAAILSGTLRVEGTQTPRPTIANATISVDFRYQMSQTDANGTTVTCGAGTLRQTTDSTGAFVLNLTLPGPSCGKNGCLTETGPFGPLKFHVTSGQAPGYFLATRLNGSQVGLDWVAALSSASTSPYQFATVSVEAPTTIAAQAWDGAGAPSTSNLSYGWAVGGVGWAVRGPTNASTIVVQASADAGPGTAAVWVNGSFNGTAIDLAPVHLYLTAAATSIIDAGFARTALDVGVAVPVWLNATGSDGYAYSATLHPGLGAPSQTSACRVAPSTGGLANVACAFLVDYSTPGQAQPTGNVSNGFSSEVWYFDSVLVSNALAVLVGPNPAQSYPDVPLHVSVGVADRTGTGPFGPACFVTGDGRFLCDPSPGPNWTISVTYPATGSYPGVVTVADASGTNRTVSDPVAIVPRPSSPSVQLSASEVGRNVPVVASAVLTGGALPLSYWWNATGPATLDSGVATSDAIPSVSFRTGLTGTVHVTLTVVDALGTLETGEASLIVDGGPAQLLVANAPLANGSVAAGVPVGIRLTMVDGFGDSVAHSSAVVAVDVPASCGPTWVNSSIGPLPGDGNGHYSLPASLWSSGAANLSVAATQAGTCRVNLSAPPMISTVSTVTIQVSEDAFHVSLVSPKGAPAGAGRLATLYSVVDRFGNPQTSGFVDVRSVFAGVVNNVESPIRAGPGGGFVWVNFTSTGPGGGTGYVISEYNQTLLTLPLPAPPSPTSVSDVEMVGLGAVALVGLGLGMVGVARRRREGGRRGPEDENDDPDEPLRRLAEGRSHVLSRLSHDRDADLDSVAEGFPGRRPDAAELAEWIGTLVTEGLVRPTVGPDGRPRFRLAGPDAGPPGLRVEVDPLALDAALARRDLDAEEPPDGGGAPG
jgi:hypothetical protein